MVRPEEITGNEMTQTSEKKTENERMYCRADLSTSVARAEQTQEGDSISNT